LTDSLRLLTSHLSDVKTRAKKLSVMRQSRQNELYTLQQCIHEHSEQIVAQVRQREATLLQEAQSRFDSVLSSDDGSSLAELEFRKSEIEKLIGDVRQLLTGSPLSCLLNFDEIATSICRLNDTSLNSATASSTRLRMPKPVRFVPASLSDVNIIIGCLQDCSFAGVDAMEGDEPQSPSTTTSPRRGTADNHLSVSRKRTASILNAVSPVRKCDSRGCRMKSVARLHRPTLLSEDASDDVLAASSSVPDTSAPSAISSSNSNNNSNSVATAEAPSTSVPVVSVSATLSGCIAQPGQARILFVIDQVLNTPLHKLHKSRLLYCNS